jgi:aminoglycoside 6'-N-acetyltransferase I
VPVVIRRADPSTDSARLLDLWFALLAQWVESRDAEADEMRRWFARPDTATFVAVDSDDRSSPQRLLGYIDVGARSIVDSCETSPVAFIEAWYVVPARQNQGIGSALMRAAEEWARANGYREMGSDAELDNTHSHHMHERLGFIETGRVVNFKKHL